MVRDNDVTPRVTRRKLLQISALGGAMVAVPALAACGSEESGSGASTSAAGGSARVTGEINIANVSNPVTQDLEKLTKQVFERQNPGIRVNFVTLPETELRAKITRDVTTRGGQFDGIVIGPYDVMQWAEREWLEPLQPYAEQDSAYKLDDLIDTTRSFFSFEDQLFAAPIYAETQNLMYRKDLTDKLGIKIPERPTWTDVLRLADQLHGERIGGKRLAGVAGRGMPAENLVVILPMIHTYDGRLFGPDWQPTLTEPETQAAIVDYITLLQRAGPPGVANATYTEALATMAQGDAAMWTDATVSVTTLENRSDSAVAGKMGYAWAPHRVVDFGGAYWGWGIGMVSSSKQKDATWKFLSWATSPEYAPLVGEQLGWTSVPPGTRTSTYDIPEYLDATPNARITLDQLALADGRIPRKPSAPGRNVAYFDYPNWWDFILKFTAPWTKAIADGSDPVAAVEESQKIAEDGVRQSGHWKG